MILYKDTQLNRTIVEKNVLDEGEDSIQHIIVSHCVAAICLSYKNIMRINHCDATIALIDM